MNKKPRDRIFIDSADRKDFERLKKPDAPLAGKENKELFMMALIVGYNEGNRIPLKDKYGFVRLEYLSEKEDAIIKSIAISEEGGLDVLLDKDKVYTIAEEYASGGIKLLKSQVMGKIHGDYMKWFESKIIDKFAEISTNKK